MGYDSFYSQLMYLFEPVKKCVLVSQPINFTEAYHTEHIHHWPGLDDSFDKAFNAHLSGLFHASTTGEYQFHVWSTNAISIRIDNSLVLEMGSSGSSITDKIITIELKPGYHLIDMYRTQSDLFAILKIEWRLGDGSWELLDGLTLQLYTRAPSYLHYDPISTLVDTYVNKSLPVVHACNGHYTVKPDLPPGMWLDEDTGAIQGQTSVAVYGEYLITAENEHGKSVTSVTIMVGDEAIPGLLGHYYRVQDERDICENIVFQTYYADLYAIREETLFIHSLQPRYGWWSNVPPVIFQGQAYIEWSGLLKTNKTGEWWFRIQKADGFTMLIDGKRALFSSGCKGVVNTMTVRVNLTEGYHTIEITYYTNKNPFVLTIEIKSPGEEEFNPLEGDIIRYLPTKPFFASTSQSQFLQGQDIEPITLRTFGVTPSNPIYSVTPDLPSGLVLSPQGIITGRPTTPFDWTSYTVSLRSDTFTSNTTILLSCISIEVPTTVKMLNKDQQEITSASLQIYKPMDPLQIECDIQYCAITINPTLPEGLSLDSSEPNSRIIGTPIVTSTAPYILTAATPSGSIQTTVTLEIPTCQYGKYLYAKTSGDNFNFYLLKSGQEFYVEKNVAASEYALSLCIPYDDYDLAFYPVPRSRAMVYSFDLYREDGLHYFHANPKEDTWFNTTLEMVPKVPPTFFVNVTSIALLPKEEIFIPYYTTGVYVPIHIDSSDTYLSFDKESSLITGSFPSKGVYSYTIICENDAGTVTVPFTFYVGTCPEGTRMIYGSKPECGINDGFELYEEDTGKLVVQRSLEYSRPTQFILCLSDKPYTSVFHNPSTDPKPYYRPLTFTDADGEVIGITEIIHINTIPNRFHLVSLFSTTDSWKMWRNKKKVSKKWTQNKFDDSKWSSYVFGEKATFDYGLSTIYLRRSVVIDSMDSFAAIRVRVHVDGGLILYLNGNEAARLNLPQGDIDRDTMAYRAEKLRDGVWISLNPALLVAGTNIIAAEVHVYETTMPYDFSVDLSLEHLQLTQHQLVTTFDGTPSSHSYPPEASGSPAEAFDTNDYSYWYSQTLPASLRYTFPNRERRYCNRMLIRGTHDDKNQPVIFEVLGILNDTVIENNAYITREVTDSIAVFNNPYLFPEAFENYIFKFYPKRSYQAYELRVHHTTNSTEEVRVNYLKFYAEQEVFCPSMKNWPAALGDSIVYGKCGFLQLGKSQRRCNVDHFQPVWEDEDRSACLSRFAGASEAFLDLGYRIYNCTLDLFNSIVSEELRTVIVREMTVKEEDVLFFLPTSCSDDTDYPSVCIDVRLRPHRLTSAYVKMELDIFNTNATNLFYKKTSDRIPPNMQILLTKKVVLRERLSGKDIFATILIVILAIAYLAQLYMYCKVTRSGRFSNRKTLPKKTQEMKKKTSMQENLI